MAPTLRPEVVFLDYQMPGMNGYQVARALRRLQGAGRMRIVLLTGSPKVTLEDAQIAGCDAVARKPAPVSALLAAMHAAACSQVQELRQAG